VWNMATYALREAVNASAQELAHGIDEFEAAGLTKLASQRVKPMRVKGSPIQFECKVIGHQRFEGSSAMGHADVVFGQVLAIHIADEAITPDGRVDVLGIQPLARMGYYDYTFVNNQFEMVIPGMNAALLAGLEGSASKAGLALKA
jgi:flavin reductase (DIM6/NTAB) family NADH-FMN oxidoreductase RutF